MPLRLTVISYKGSALAQPLSAEFDQQGGSIGRKADNTLVLVDPEQYLSGHHARISFDDGQYWLNDTSTNGSYLVNAGTNLNNTSAILQDQEVVRMGDYELKVELHADAIPQPEPLLNVEPLFAGPFVADINESGPFSAAVAPLQEPAFSESPPAAVFHDSFVLPPVVSTPPAEEDKPAWLRELDSLSQSCQPSVDAMPIAPEVPSPFISQPLEQTAPSLDEFLRTPAPAEVNIAQAPALNEPQTPTSVLAPVSDSRGAEAELMRLFLQGAGIQNDAFLPPEQWARAMMSAGGLFRCLIEGIMDVLRARAEMKSEFRVAVTTIRAVDNNPLKFNPDVESVLKLMLGPHNPAFMSPNIAVSEAVKDIKNHQLAMTAGIQASLAAILQRFAPDTLEQGLGEGLVFQKKARCWELYCEKYPQLKSLAMEDFFGDEFVEAYEKQMRLLDRH